MSAFAIYYLVVFFSGSKSLVKQTSVTPGSNATAQGQGGSQSTGASKVEIRAAKYDTSAMSPEIAYIFDVANQARPRLAGAKVASRNKSRPIKNA